MNDSKQTNNSSSELPINGGNHSLDDLFANARHDAAYLETGEERHALLNRAMVQPQTTTIAASELLTPRSTYPIGAILMTTVSLGVAAFLAFSLFNTSPSTQPITTAQTRNDQPSLTQPSPASQTFSTNTSDAQPVIVSSIVTERSADNPFVLNGSTPAIPRDTSLTSPIDLSGFTIIEASQAEQAQLGLYPDKYGAVGYFVNQDGRTILRTFPPLAGMTMIPGGFDTSKITIAEITPALVTNTDGMKRYFKFESGDFVGSKGMSAVRIHDTSNGTEQNDAYMFAQHKSDSNGNSRELVTNLRESRKINAGDTTRVEETQLEEHIMTRETDDSDGVPVPPLPPMPNRSSRVNTSVIEINNNIDSVVGSVKIDSILKAIGFNPKKMNGGQVRININSTKDLNKCFDSTGLAKLQQALEQLQTNIASTKGMPDSNGLVTIRKQIISGMNLNVPDSLMKLVSNVLNIAKANMPDPNKLVPVMIENRAHPGKENAVIFWYAPSPKLTSVFQKELPGDGVTAVQATKAFQNLSIYPNPATSNSTVSFDLSESRTVTLALYNLLGQKLLEASKPTTQSAGHNAMKIDLSTMQAGVYILVATTDKGEQLSQRIVVEK
jgi:hypothetical protein